MSIATPKTVGERVKTFLFRYFYIGGLTQNFRRADIAFRDTHKDNPLNTFGVTNEATANRQKKAHESLYSLEKRKITLHLIGDISWSSNQSPAADGLTEPLAQEICRLADANLDEILFSRPLTCPSVPLTKHDWTIVLGRQGEDEGSMVVKMQKPTGRTVSNIISHFQSCQPLLKFGLRAIRQQNVGMCQSDDRMVTLTFEVVDAKNYQNTHNFVQLFWTRAGHQVSRALKPLISSRVTCTLLYGS